MLRLRYVLLLLLLPALFPAAAQAQQPPPVSLEILAGFDGAGKYRVGHWFPVRIVASNDGADLRGFLEWRFPGDDGGTFRYELDLPRGARKQIVLPVVTDQTTRSATVVMVVNGQDDMRRAPTRLDPITSDQVAIGVISSDRTLLNSLGAARIANNFTTAVTHLDPRLLPEDAVLLAGLDVIFIHDLRTADLTDRQREALTLWVQLGGQLVVGGGAEAAQTVPGLAPLLPVEVGTLQQNVATTALATLANRSDLENVLPSTTASAFTPRPGQEVEVWGDLLAASNVGAGRVLFAAFDLAALRAWGGEAALWERLLSLEPKAQLGQSFRSRSENLLRDSLELPALRLPSTGLLLLLMGVYILVIGPVNFLLLRRLRRVELAWVTTPLLVVVFLAAAYGSSFALRGTNPQMTQLTIVQGFEGVSHGQTTAFLGVYSPQRRSYRLDFAPEALVTPGSFESFRFVTTPVTSDGATTGLRDLLIDVSALRTLMVEQPTTSVPAVTSSLERTNTRVRGAVSLTGTVGLRDALIVYSSSAQALGDLQPGKQLNVDLRTTQSNFPDLVNATEGGLINHYRVLYDLFGNDRFALGGPTFQGDKGIPDRDGVYLVGWADTPHLTAQIDGTASRQQGETLYIIRLEP